MGRSSTQRLRTALGVVVGRETKQRPVSFCRGVCRCKRNQFQPTKTPRCRYPALQRSHTSKNWQGPTKPPVAAEHLLARNATPQSSNIHLLPQRLLAFTPYSGELHRFGLSNNLGTALFKPSGGEQNVSQLAGSAHSHTRHLNLLCPTRCPKTCSLDATRMRTRSSSCFKRILEPGINTTVPMFTFHLLQIIANGSSTFGRP
jgi:hypothetical protein